MSLKIFIAVKYKSCMTFTFYFFYNILFKVSPTNTSSYDIKGLLSASTKLINSSAITLPTFPFITFKNTLLGIVSFFSL